MYSQYNEDDVVLNYFKDRKINVLDIGANDGVTISNSLLFTKNGNTCVLVEASPITYEVLVKNMKEFSNVICVNACLSDKNESVIFYHNVTHFNKNDKDLLSTIVESNFKESSKNNRFETFNINSITFDDFIKMIPFKSFEYISIDVEGVDYIVLSQIDLEKYKTELLLIEYNNNLDIKNKIISYCSKYGLSKILLENGTNIILAK